MELTIYVDSLSDLEQVTAFFGRLHQQSVLASLDGLGAPILNVPPDGTPVTDALAVKKRKRGRPRQPQPGETATNVVDLVDEPDLFPVAPGEAVSLTDVLSAMPEPGAPPDAPKDGLTPEQMRTQGRELLLRLVNDNPAKGPSVRRITAKYNVKQLAEIPLDRAAEFLADAMMLTNAGEA